MTTACLKAIMILGSCFVMQCLVSFLVLQSLLSTVEVTRIRTYSSKTNKLRNIYTKES